MPRIVRHSTLAPIVGQMRHESYLFQSLAANDPDAMIVDTPLPSPLYTGRYVLPVGRRLETPDGRFDGIVVSVVQPDAFRDFFRTIETGTKGAISVFHPGGVVLFREPSTSDPLGEEAADHPVVLAAQGAPGRGVVTGPLTAGGAPYITVYRTVAAPSLIVASR